MPIARLVSHGPVDDRLQVGPEAAGGGPFRRGRVQGDLTEQGADGVHVTGRGELLPGERLRAGVRADARRVGVAQPGGELDQFGVPSPTGTG